MNTVAEFVARRTADVRFVLALRGEDDAHLWEPPPEKLAEWRREAFRCPGPACDLVGSCP